jgi:type I restriction enzyme, S subunit
MELTKTIYRETEVGLIPEDWHVLTIEDVAKVVGGGTPSTTISNYWNGNIEWFTPTEISHVKYSSSSNRKISIEGFNNSSAQILPIGTILMTTRASIGDMSILLNEATTNQGFQSLIAKERIYNEFLYYLMLTKKGELLKNASGSTFLEISPKKVKAIKIPLPPTLTEQKAIATALSDVDDLIANLDKLINKKKAIKQGAMQQLFAEKKKWERKTIKEFGFDISDGNYSAKYPKSSEFKSSGVPFIRANNIKKMTVVDDDMRYISEELHSELKKGHLKNGDILITNRGDIGQTAIVPDKFIGANINAQIVRINTCGKLNRLYFFYFMRLNSTQNHIQNMQTGSALKQLPVNRLFDIEIAFPKEDVQILIGETLFEIDTEILSIEMIKAKYQEIKKGMMQELLTGKTRLV